MPKVTITPEQMAAYRAAARLRDRKKRDRIRAHYQRAWEIARQAAEHLRQNFGVTRVVLFGSMRSADLVHERSDLDLAVWGLDPQHHYRVIGQLLALDPAIPVDVILFEEASPRLQTEILDTGIEL